MGRLQKHIFVTVIGIVLSIIAVAWLQPQSAGGTTLVVVFLVLLVNAVGAIFIRGAPAGSAEPGG